VAALLAGCASPPPAPPAPVAAPAPSVEAAPQPAAPAAPELTPAQAKAQAQKLALEAVDHLQSGDEPGARQALNTALGLDPANDLARKMSEQISADAQKELGPAFFRYTVQRDDSLSKLAQQYLGDRLRFYILAKYNDMANPSRLAAGQVIKIPGKASAATVKRTLMVSGPGPVSGFPLSLASCGTTSPVTPAPVSRTAVGPKKPCSAPTSHSMVSPAGIARGLIL
jgi:LysM repeat protein